MQGFLIDRGWGAKLVGAAGEHEIPCCFETQQAGSSINYHRLSIIRGNKAMAMLHLQE